MKQLAPLLIVIFFCSSLLAQQSYVPDMGRALFHNKLDKAQKALLARDGKADDAITAYGDEELNLQLTYQATTHVDNIQQAIELDTVLSNNLKITYLRGLSELLTDVGNGITAKTLKWSMLPQIVSSYEMGIKLDRHGQSILPALLPLSYNAGIIFSGNFAFAANKNIQATKEYLFRKYLEENPTRLLKELVKRPDFYFTDSLVSVAARRMPEELISYAQARNTILGQKIAANPDPLVKMIVAFSEDPKGQLYFPFLDKMSKGELSSKTVAAAIADSAKYYSLLVKTQIDYAHRISLGDTPVVMKGLQTMLEIKSRETYVTTINGLHEEPAAIRFKKIQGLSAEELYYLMVMNEMEIYTSSYMYVYQRMFEVMPVKSADTLLQLIAYDKYKKFLTLASNYNTLDDFLSKMSPESSTALMTSFVNNLDRSKSVDDIEDAVDVANAYASIKDSSIRTLMLNQVTKNLEDAAANNKERAIVIYRLEKLIMESADSTKTIDLSKELGILPVYEVKNSFMRDSLGRIILQMFFLDDGTGKGSFNTLLNIFSDKKKWKVRSTPNWVQFTSIGSTVPFMLFANRALDGLKDLDEAAQWNLTNYLVDSGYSPSIVVHRGHSYSLKSTIEKMQPTSKVVVLGSCGAYHNLTDILKISPDAYIIGSKQTGMGAINIPLFTYLVEHLKNGEDIQWPTMKVNVGNMVNGVRKEDYDDYIFPHQNLGALFIKAYKIALAKNEDGSPTQLGKL